MTRRTTFRVPAVLAAVATLLAAGGGTASAAGPAVSSPNPYDTAGCLALDNQPGSVNYRNSEVEPMVSVDPTNSSHLVGAWQQDRWNNGGAHGLVAGYSTDGGTTWTVSPQPFSVCYHASGYPGTFLNYQRASDPWVSIGPGTPGNPTSGSTVYSDSISFDQTPYPGDPNAVDNAVGAAVSYDGGATWTNVQRVIADPCVTQSSGPPGYVCNNSKSFLFNDKNSITADPTTPGVAYAVWDRLVAPPAAPSGFIHERAYFGQAYMSKTTDYGQTWSTPQTLTRLASDDQTIANQIVVNRQSGELYDFFTLIQNASNAGGHRGLSVAFIKSGDGGATWSKPQVVCALETAGVSDPNNLQSPYQCAARPVAHRRHHPRAGHQPHQRPALRRLAGRAFQQLRQRRGRHLHVERRRRNLERTRAGQRPHRPARLQRQRVRVLDRDSGCDVPAVGDHGLRQ